MEDELIRLSTQDTLTGLYNRNFYEVELERLQNSRQFPISIMVADMDILKAVNDRYGHLAGDRLIQKVARCLRAAFRSEDIVARIGGDEFAVLLPQTEIRAAEASIVRLQALLKLENDPLLSLSMGVATGDEGDDLQMVMRQADDRMYLEKFAKKKAQQSN
jgi:diguanylate cyclase (GGDEF)-like protein